MDTPTIPVLIILALATARLVILVSRDSITDPIREWWYMILPPDNDERAGLHYQTYRRANKTERTVAKPYTKPWSTARWYIYDEAAPQRKPRFGGRVVQCPDCLGVWMGALVAVSWWQVPTVTEPVSVGLALAMAASWIARRGGYR